MKEIHIFNTTLSDPSPFLISFHGVCNSRPEVVKSTSVLTTTLLAIFCLLDLSLFSATENLIQFSFSYAPNNISNNFNITPT